MSISLVSVVKFIISYIIRMEAPIALILVHVQNVEILEDFAGRNLMDMASVSLNGLSGYGFYTR